MTTYERLNEWEQELSATNEDTNYGANYSVVNEAIYELGLEEIEDNEDELSQHFEELKEYITLDWVEVLVNQIKDYLSRRKRFDETETISFLDLDDVLESKFQCYTGEKAIDNSETLESETIVYDFTFTDKKQLYIDFEIAHEGEDNFATEIKVLDVYAV